MPLSCDSNSMLSYAKCVDLSILPMKPTYHLPTVESWLDVIFVNSVELIDTFGQISYPGLSNHDLVYASFKIISEKKVKIVFVLEILRI